LITLFVTFGNFDWMSLVLMLLFFGGGVLLFRFARYKDRECLPAPDFGALRRWTPGVNLQKRAEELETKLRNSISVGERTKVRREKLVQECYAALANCDYVRAHVAGRLIVLEDSKWPEGLMGLSIAAAALGDLATSGTAFAALQKQTGFRTASSAWAAGWTLALAGDWTQAEALLQRAAVLRPADATVLSLLALAQSRRGKFHSAIDNARRASSLKPGNNEHSRQLTMLLLEAGSVREAQPRLAAVQHDATSDPELALAMVRLHLTLGQLELAEKWTETVTGFAGKPHLLLRLAEAYEMARKHDRAAVFYRGSLQAAHYPEAWHGLGRIEVHKANRVEAERCFLAALDASRRVGPNGLDWLGCLPNILAALIGLADLAPECKAWIAVLPPNLPVAPLSNRSMLVFARGKQEARQLLEKVLAAIDARMTSCTHQLQWREAPTDYQPAGPVRPGVEGFSRIF
jgi:tetratricopeptide (TPR) repeat protein